MRYAFCLLWISLNVANGCEDASQQKSVTEVQNKTKTASLQPVPDSGKEIECRVLDMSTGEMMTVKGHQAVYMSDPLPSTYANFPISVSTFSYQGTHWIGLSGDLFIYRKGAFIGMAINGEGLAWLTNFASNRANRSLDDDILAFQREVSLAELGHAFLREWQRDSRPDEPKGWTNFGEVIPNPYVTYLYMTGRPEFVSAAVDDKLLKVTVSDQTGAIFPSVWVDLDTKKTVKAENYEYDPDAEIRELLKWQYSMRPQNGTKSTSLQPVPETVKEIECRVLDMSTGETTTVKGRQALYLSEQPQPRLTSHHPMAVTAFLYRDIRWVGLNASLYLYRDGHLIGMKVVQSGLTWLTNYADNSLRRSLAEEITAFEHDITPAQLYDAYHRSWQTASLPGAAASQTSFSAVIPQKYNEYLRRSRPEVTGGGQPKFVSAAVDGKLLKVTVSNQSGVIFPTIWVDLDTKKAIKAENYEYDPDERGREQLKPNMSEAPKEVSPGK